jgi:hypothetical protein
MNRGNVHTSPNDSFQQWFAEIPLVTKILTVSTLLLGAMTTFKMLSAEKLVLIWPYVTEKFQIWRFFTAAVFSGSFSFNFVMHLWVLYENCKRYELNPYNTGAGGNSADFLWMILVCLSILLAVSYLFDLYVLSEPLLYVILYVWSRKEPEAQLNIFGFRFKSLYLPWVYVGIRLLMGGSITEPLIGIGVGHVYFFFVTIFPTLYHRELIKTPKFCIDIVQYATGLTVGGGGGGRAWYQPAAAAAGPAAQPAGGGGAGNTDNLRFRQNAQQGQQRPQTYNWGTGRSLGST